MECIELKSSLEDIWCTFVERFPDSCLGHDLAWRRVISEGLGHKSRYLMATENGKIEGILPIFEMRHFVLGKRLVSLPVLDQAGIAASTDAARYALEHQVTEILRDNNYKYAQLRSKPLTEANTQSPKAVLTLDICPDVDSVWKGFKDKVRNQVRKAEKSGLEVRVGGSELLSSFYSVYSANMRDLGVPALPTGLFSRTLAAFGEDRAKVITVVDGNEPVGACIEIFFKNSASVPWASSSRKHFERCPNNLLYWAAIRMACERGCTLFDFGRSTWDTGPFIFKKQWGAIPNALNWEYYTADGSDHTPDFTTSNPRYRLLVNAWQRLPIPIANILGPYISSQVA